jgi:hypothetical protein
MRRVGGALDLNSSSLGGAALGGLDSSMLSMGGGCGEIDTTARLGARASLSASQFGRGSFVRPGGAPPSAKKPAAAHGRPSLALQPGDRCVPRAGAAFWREREGAGPAVSKGPHLTHPTLIQQCTLAHALSRAPAGG